MSKVWDKPITADTDWGGDASTDNLPVSGRQVQAWIKGNIKNDDAISLLIAKWLNEHTTNSITFWKGLPIDSGTLKWVDEHLTVIGGTGSSETPQDLPFIYDPVKKAWEFKGDFVVTGAITMFGSLSGFQPSTVTEAVEVDGETIVKTKNSHGQWQLTAIGGGSGSGGGISAAEVNILISNALEPYALSTSIPTDNKQLSNGAGYATVSDLDTRINNLINGAPAAYDTLKEIADVLAGNVNSIGDILTALDTKATKTYLDTELTKYVKLATAQPIEAQHNFVNGLQIGGLPITKSASANNTIYLDANLVVSGAITMFGSGSTTFPTIWANIPFNPEHLSWDGSQWNVIVEGGSGSGGLDTNAVNVLISEYLTQNSYATISDISSALVGYATQGWVGDNYLSKSGGTVSGSFRAFEVKRTDEIGSFVSFSNYTGYMGSLGFRDTDMPGFFDSAGSAYFLIHSGNIGEYKAGDSDKLGGVYSYQYARIRQNEAINADDTADELSGGKLSGGSNWPYAYYAFITSGAGNYKMQFNGYANELKYRAGDESGLSNKNWRDVAFTDSNVASATKLQTPRTIWGQSFDGTSDINGDIHFSAGGNYKIGTPYAVGHEVLYNYITFGAAENGIEYVSGKWTSSGDLVAHRFATYHSDHAIDIFNNGNVAIGGTTADAKLHVYGDAIVGGNISVSCPYIATDPQLGSLDSVGASSITASPGYGLYCWIRDTGRAHIQVGDDSRMGTSLAYDMVLQPLGGNVAIGGTEAIEKLTVHGNLLTTGVITMFSQASMKDVIDYDGLSLEQLAQIRPTRFTWKDSRDSLVHAGGIADEVMQVLPEVVHRTKDDKLTMDYGSAGFFIAASLIKPVIDHEQRLQSAEKEIIDLKAENKRLREQLRVV